MRKPLSMHCAASSVIQLYSMINRSYLLDIFLAEAESHGFRKPTLLDAEYVDEGIYFLRRGPQRARQLHVGR